MRLRQTVATCRHRPCRQVVYVQRLPHDRPSDRWMDDQEPAMLDTEEASLKEARGSCVRGRRCLPTYSHEYTCESASKHVLF